MTERKRVADQKTATQSILEVQDLKKYFEVKHGAFTKKQVVKAVDGVSLSIGRRETHGLVGESGCGKSTLGRAIVRLYKPTEGKIFYKGDDITELSDKKLLPYRKYMQMIFQDPYASLDPRMMVGEIIKEPMSIHNLYDPKEREERVAQLLKIVGLKPDHIRRFPHEFSGGQRQRIGIARTLALDPEFIVCDEPISALDVSIQAQIINLLEQLQEERGISYIFIAHDISMVKHISTKISVMYLGNIVESGDHAVIYKDPIHPYTRALISAIPIPDPRIAKIKERIILQGELPSPLNPPAGCPFNTRCIYAKTECSQMKPQLKSVQGRMVACHLY